MLLHKRFDLLNSTTLEKSGTTTTTTTTTTTKKKKKKNPKKYVPLVSALCKIYGSCIDYHYNKNVIVNHINQLV